MLGQPLESHCKQVPFKNDFQFRFGGLHLESVVKMSGDIDVVMTRSAAVENVGVVVRIMYVCCWKLTLHQPAENLRFFQGGCPWFSSSLQVPERATVTRKTPKHPELDALGKARLKVLTVFLNSHESQKYSKKHREWGANLHLPLFAG
jgi:hypothetical protein